MVAVDDAIAASSTEKRFERADRSWVDSVNSVKWQVRRSPAAVRLSSRGAAGLRAVEDGYGDGGNAKGSGCQGSGEPCRPYDVDLYFSILSIKSDFKRPSNPDRTGFWAVSRSIRSVPMV